MTIESSHGGRSVDVSAGVLAYLHADSAASPREDEAAVAALPGADPQLVSQVKSMVQESVSVPVDWDELSLGDAGRYVAQEMRRRHPDLTKEAADALAWNFTFAWR